MKQVFNKKGKIIVEEVPIPCVRDGYVLVSNIYSAISAGTESSSIAGASGSMISRALKKPELVKKVIDKVLDKGLESTINLIKQCSYF